MPHPSLIDTFCATAKAWTGKRSVRSLAMAGEIQHSVMWRMLNRPMRDGPTLRQVEGIARALEVEPWELIAGKKKSELLADLLRERGLTGTAKETDWLLTLYSLLGKDHPDALGVLVEMATNDPESFDLLIQLWANPAVGQVALEAAAGALRKGHQG